MRYCVLPAAAAAVLLSACGRPSPAGGERAARPAAESAAPASAAPAPVQVATAADSGASGTPLRDAYHTAPLDTVDARTYQGWKYYNLNCARCHGEDVQGTSIAPHLILSLKPDGAVPNEAVFLQVVCGGRVQKGMPSWCQQGMSTAQIDTIYAYVKARSDARMHPGRPARRTG